MRVLVLQHIACEPPGVYEDVLHEREAELVRVELDEGEPIPDTPVDAIVAMGGPMSVNDEDSLPWLVAEKQFVAGAVRSGTPYWGVCLGVQLLARAAGASVYRMPEGPEIGWHEVALTEAGQEDPQRAYHLIENRGVFLGYVEAPDATADAHLDRTSARIAD